MRVPEFPAAATTTGHIERITVQVHVGHDRMAGTDDPLFLRLHGPGGREFRLAKADGSGLKRDADGAYVLGATDAPETNVAHAELNDPTDPPIDIADITGVSLAKGMDPIPNVRGIAELDDRVEIQTARVEIHATAGGPPICYERNGPFWLSLSCGLSVALAPST